MTVAAEQVWPVIVVSGAGTYLFRASGCLPLIAQHLRARGWLDHVPAAVLVVLAIDAVAPRSGMSASGVVATSVATTAVGLASLARLPLLARLTIGSGLYGLILVGHP